MRCPESGLPRFARRLDKFRRICNTFPMKLTSLEGIFRNGRVELLEPAPAQDNSRVIVTFLPSEGKSSAGVQGMTPEEAAHLRARLHTFAEDWDHAEMDIYNALS